MDKMKLAHEYLLKYTGATVADAWAYADAMQAEADKRKPSGLPDALKEEWQPDWSQAPEWAKCWVMTSRGATVWVDRNPRIRDGGFYFRLPCGNAEAPSFGYTGNWQDSLRKRPL